MEATFSEQQQQKHRIQKIITIISAYFSCHSAKHIFHIGKKRGKKKKILWQGRDVYQQKDTFFHVWNAGFSSLGTKIY